MKCTKNNIFAAIMSLIAIWTFDAGMISAVEGLPGYHSEVLDNGAMVVARYIPDSPVATIQVRVLAGLSSEGPYAGTGISHYVEHMVFRALGEDEDSPARKAVKALGGTLNGSTGQDSAEYHITVPSENVRPAMEILAGMVMSPPFTEEEVELERDVILREMSMINDNPGRKSLRLLFQKAFRRHVYRHPIIGHEELFLELDKKDLKKYHKAVYVPDRMVIGVAGGVPVSDVFSYAEEIFGKYPRGREWLVSSQAEPPQIFPYEKVFEMDTDVGYIAMGFRSASIYCDDLYPGNVAAFVLGSGTDSILYRKIVREKQLLNSITAFNLTPGDPGLFVVAGRGDPGKLMKARSAIIEVIDELADLKEDGTALERARNSVLASYLRSHENTRGLVSSMTSFSLYKGDPSFFDIYIGKINDVTVQDILAFKEEYLLERSLTTVYVVPRGFREQMTDGVEHIREKAEEKSVTRTLDNGLELVAFRRGFLPLAAVTFISSGGLGEENHEDNGVSSLMASLLLKGTSNRSEEDIVPVIERMGGRISSSGGIDGISVSMNLMSRDLAAGMDIFADVITSPSFPEDEIEKKKKKVLSSIKERDKNIFSKARDALRKLLYEGHPYSLPSSGEIETVERLNRVDIDDFYRNNVLSEGAVISVVGDIDPGKALDMIEKAFSGWRPSGDTPRMDRPVMSRELKEKELSLDREQSIVIVGYYGVDRHDDDRYALRVLSDILSGRDGILFDIVREDGGLAYTSGVNSSNYSRAGHFSLYSATTAQNIAEAKKKIFDAVKMAMEGNFSDEDLDSSKAKLIADHSGSLQSNSVISSRIASGKFHGSGAFYYREYPSIIEEISREDVIRAAERIFRPGPAAIVRIFSSVGEEDSVYPVRDELPYRGEVKDEAL